MGLQPSMHRQVNHTRCPGDRHVTLTELGRKQQHRHGHDYGEVLPTTQLSAPMSSMPSLIRTHWNTTTRKVRLRTKPADGDLRQSERHSTNITCAAGFFGGTCTSTTTVTATGAPVPAGLTVNFSGAGTGTETTNAAGQATFLYAGSLRIYTITASFPAQAGYGCFQQQHDCILLHHLRCGAHGFSHRV